MGYSILASWSEVKQNLEKKIFTLNISIMQHLMFNKHAKQSAQECSVEKQQTGRDNQIFIKKKRHQEREITDINKK